MNIQPLGFYDSGAGGISVLAELKRRMPSEDVIYVGDTLHMPYGAKSHEQLLGYARQIVDFMLGQNVKGIVVACNTATSMILPDLKELYPEIPLVGTIKAGSRGAIQATLNRKIGVAATQNTVNSRMYTSTIQNEDHRYEVFEQACPALAPMVEKGIVEGEEVREAVSEYLAPLLRQDIDTLVLGCTHYPFLLPLIQEFLGTGVRIVDPAVEIIKEVENLLRLKGALNVSGHSGQYTFYVSGDPTAFTNTVSVLSPGLISQAMPLTVKG